jgi:hypothetical protein
VGYHDKNWGDAPFFSAVQSWYWGHARLGPYSLVWFDALTYTAKEYFSAYVVKDGEVVESTCKKNSVVVRPWGANSEYPPQVTSGPPEGLGLVFDLGKKDGALVVNVTSDLVVLDAVVYQRFIGSVHGCFEKSGKCFGGRTLYEQFKFPPPE